MRHFWQWFCGYVCLSLNGRQINRFLNLCCQNHIFLWKISSKADQIVQAHIRIKDIYYLKPYLRKTKTKMHIICKKGFPFWCHRHPRMKWMLILIPCLLGMWIYSFSYIWQIEITGNTLVSTSEIVEFLHTQKIENGIPKNKILCSTLEADLRKQFHEIGWVSVYVQDTKLCIEVKESLYPEFERNEGTQKQSDFIANKDATIYSIITRRGIALVKDGDSVKKGDLLVLGQSHIKDDAGELKTILTFAADAQIYGDVTYEIAVPISEIEILATKLANVDFKNTLYCIGNQKISNFLEKLDKNGVIILDKNVMIDKKEKNIVLKVYLKTRERIGINIPVEE